MDNCLEVFDICALYRESIMAARRMSGRDFEDNLQTATAEVDFLQAIVTRDMSDFAASPIRVIDPSTFLAAIRA